MTVKKFRLICNQEAVADATIVKAVACCDYLFQWLPVRRQCWTDTQPGYLDEQDDDAADALRHSYGMRRTSNSGTFRYSIQASL